MWETIIGPQPGPDQRRIHYSMQNSTALYCAVHTIVIPRKRSRSNGNIVLLTDNKSCRLLRNLADDHFIWCRLEWQGDAGHGNAHCPALTTSKGRRNCSFENERTLPQKSTFSTFSPDRPTQSKLCETFTKKIAAVKKRFPHKHILEKSFYRTAKDCFRWHQRVTNRETHGLATS